MKYSFVIPTHNRPKMLEKVINQIYDSCLTDYEIVIIENNSTEENIAKYKQINLKKNTSIYFISFQSDFAIGEARNHGIKAAKGEYIFLMDDDDIFHKDFLPFLEKEKNKLVKNVYRCWSIRRGKVEKPGHGKKVSKLYFLNMVTVRTMLCKRKFLIENNVVFPENIIMEDNGFAERLWSTGEPQYILKVISSDYYVNPVSITGGRRNHKKELKAIATLKTFGKQNWDVFYYKIWNDTYYQLSRKDYYMNNKELDRDYYFAFQDFIKSKRKSFFFRLPLGWKFLYITQRVKYFFVRYK